MKNHPVYKKYLVSKEGVVKNQVTGKTLKQTSNIQGYVTVSLFDEESCKWVRRKVHRLVAQTYIENPENKREVNHIDGSKDNNRVENLEWVTSKENKEHAWENGLYKDVGENHHSTYLTNDLVHTICERMQQGYRNKEICEEFSLERYIVADIRAGRKWSHISKDYNIKIKRQNRKSPEKVVEVAMMLEQKHPANYISQKTGVAVYDVNRIKRRAIFKDLTQTFNF
jgi:hypothetical protein